MKIYLASKSPRRKQLLLQMGVEFEVLLIDTPEELALNETPAAYSKRVTTEKLSAAWNNITQEKKPVMPVLCADTEVVLDGRILGKPRDYLDAFDMIKSYSGRSHEVITSVGLQYFNHTKVRMDITSVYVAALSDNDIHQYLATGDYKDKAGAYGIQSHFGQYIYRIEGCFYSVMGLPLNTVRELLAEII